ncbi:MAG: cbb3-type cytochrome oxidase assembly protein CcoS [gamma proteobacterium symbiont of Taylorina sp.]|nr:cbb3-type cytochrome oxidase assembly protein CcoS [gamma proteobacterium symbiont of Taylorina sp.]
MDVIYGLIPSMILIGIVLVIILFWAIKSGQFDDFEGDAQRILMDEDLSPNTTIPEPSAISENSAEEKNMKNTQEKQDK